MPISFVSLSVSSSEMVWVKQKDTEILSFIFRGIARRSYCVRPRRAQRS